MRIDEITLPRTINDAVSILNQHGYKQIGSGEAGGKGDSKVFWKEGQNSVLKLYPTDDASFTDFVNFCIQNPNPHFPRFSRKSLRINDKYSAIKTEKLEYKHLYYEVSAYISDFATYTRTKIISDTFLRSIALKAILH